jgi:hypothetical protein
MKPHGTSTLIAIAALMTGVLGQALVESRFNGIWQGKMHDLPAITLTLANEGGKLEGKVTFFLPNATRRTNRGTSRVRTAPQS